MPDYTSFCCGAAKGQNFLPGHCCILQHYESLSTHILILRVFKPGTTWALEKRWPHSMICCKIPGCPPVLKIVQHCTLKLNFLWNIRDTTQQHAPDVCLRLLLFHPQFINLLHHRIKIQQQRLQIPAAFSDFSVLHSVLSVASSNMQTCSSFLDITIWSAVTTGKKVPPIFDKGRE